MTIPSDIAGAPPPGTPVPVAIDLIADGPVELVWLNQVGGITARINGPAPRFAKWNPAGSGESLAAEAERLRWLEAHDHPAPLVLDYEATDDGELLVTAAIDGKSAVDACWTARPDDAIRAVAEGLRRLHALPVDDCPYDWGVESRLGIPANGMRCMDTPAKQGPGNDAGSQRTAPSNRSSATQSQPRLTQTHHLAHEAPPIDRPVVCHGDACAPNTLIAADGSFAATVDVGRLGVADRWADLAVATMSFEWNYSGYDEAVFWETYGIEPDPLRIDYYRRLWNSED